MPLEIKYSKKFLKYYQKRIANNSKLAKKFDQRFKLFLENPHNPILRSHKLSGAEQDLYAFSITGDVRVVYYIEEDIMYVVDIGTHNQVY